MFGASLPERVACDIERCGIRGCSGFALLSRGGEGGRWGVVRSHVGIHQLDIGSVGARWPRESVGGGVALV